MSDRLNTSAEASITGGLDGQPMGLVAGWGNFPVEVAERCRQAGTELHVIGLRGHADPRLQQLADRFRWMGVAKLGRHIDFFRRAGVTRVALAGKLFKDRLLYHGRGWLGLVPDWTCIRQLAPIFLTRTRDARDDTLLGCIVAAYEQQGIQVMNVSELAPRLLIEPGVLAGRPPTRAQWADIRFGWRIARHMGGLDIGQSVTVKDQLILGVEAIEGTDALIGRTGQLCPRGGFTLVKVSKPNQDMRFDVPTIGPQTVRQMAAAGGRLIAIEAGKTIVVQQSLTWATAQQHRISLVAIDPAEMPAEATAH